MKQGVLCKYCKPYEGDTNMIYCQKKNCDVQGYKCTKSECTLHEFKPTAFVVIGVGRCDECPCVKTERTPRAGYAFDYFCKACDGRKIVGYVEWDSEIPEIPDWCPFKAKEN